MMIKVFNFKRCRVLFIICLAVVLLLAAAGIFNTDVLPVWNENRQIPIYSVETMGKKASITFDCAWGAADMPQILNTLKKENVKATFFIVGQWAEKYPDVVKQIARDGHDIANHSYSHLRMGAFNLNEEKNTKA